MRKNSIIIKKLPKDLNIIQMIEDTIDKNNQVCPHCGESRKFDLYENIVSMVNSKKVQDYGIEDCFICSRWYGKHDEDENSFAFLRFWEKNRHWKRKDYKCHTCGLEWTSQPFPTCLDDF